MRTLMGNNATVSTKRKGTFVSGTGVTPGYAAYLSNISCYIDDRSTALTPVGFAIDFDIQLSCEDSIDIRDGDLMVGYNPLNFPVEPVYIVVHTGLTAGGIGKHRDCYLKVYRG